MKNYGYEVMEITMLNNFRAESLGANSHIGTVIPIQDMVLKQCLNLYNESSSFICVPSYLPIPPYSLP